MNPISQISPRNTQANSKDCPFSLTSPNPSILGVCFQGSTFTISVQVTHGCLPCGLPSSCTQTHSHFKAFAPWLILSTSPVYFSNHLWSHSLKFMCLFKCCITKNALNCPTISPAPVLLYLDQGSSCGKVKKRLNFQTQNSVLRLAFYHIWDPVFSCVKARIKIELHCYKN